MLDEQRVGSFRVITGTRNRTHTRYLFTHVIARKYTMMSIRLCRRLSHATAARLLTAQNGQRQNDRFQKRRHPQPYIPSLMLPAATNPWLEMRNDQSTTAKRTRAERMSNASRLILDT